MWIDANLHSKRHPVMALIGLAYGMTWLAVVPYAPGLWPVPMFPFRPLVASIAIALVCGGWAETRRLLLWMVQWRVAPREYAFALVVPAAVAAADRRLSRQLSPGR